MLALALSSPSPRWPRAPAIWVSLARNPPRLKPSAVSKDTRVEMEGRGVTLDAFDPARAEGRSQIS
jgi:hypothetical protein